LNPSLRKSSHAILLVGHDTDAVFRIADCITVTVNGTVIACGTPEFVRNSPEVRVADRPWCCNRGQVVLQGATDDVADSAALSNYLGV
jgi:ABC-type branched-subunit amino acid transport system ATPase component